MKRFLLGLLLSVNAFAASSFTTHYNLEKPADGDTGWGNSYRSNLNTLDTQLFTSSSSITDHIADPTAAHAASAISSVAGALTCPTSLDVQDFLDCLDANFGAIVGGTAVTINDDQTITGQKTFSAQLILSAGIQALGPYQLTQLSTGLVHSDAVGMLTSSLLVNADIDAAAAISYSKLGLTGQLLDADVNSSAAIARTKLASGSNNHVIINNGSGVLSSEATLAKSRGGSGQDNSSLTFPASGTLATLAGSETLTNKTLTAPAISSPTGLVKGDVGLGNVDNTSDATKNAASVTLTNKTLTAPVMSTFVSNGVTFTLPTTDGSSGQFIKTNASGVLSFASALSNPMDAAGQLIYGASSGTPTKVPAGSSGQYLKSNGTSAPAFTSFATPVISVYKSGATNHNANAACLWMRVRMIGAGGAGAGSSTNSAANGVAGGTGSAATFGNLSAGGGSGGAAGAGGGGAGGTFTVGAGWTDTGGSTNGVAGSSSAQTPASVFSAGTPGASSFFGGGGLYTASVAGGPAPANSGAGGGGAGSANSAVLQLVGASGGSAAYVEAINTSCAGATFAYSVPAATTGGTAGTSGAAGGAGGAGKIIVEEFLQ